MPTVFLIRWTVRFCFSILLFLSNPFDTGLSFHNGLDSLVVQAKYNPSSNKPVGLNCNFSSSCITVWIVDPKCLDGILSYSGSKYINISLTATFCHVEFLKHHHMSIYWMWNSKVNHKTEITRCRFSKSCTVPGFAISTSVKTQRWLNVSFFCDESSFAGSVAVSIYSKSKKQQRNLPYAIVSVAQKNYTFSAMSRKSDVNISTERPTPENILSRHSKKRKINYSNTRHNNTTGPKNILSMSQSSSLPQPKVKKLIQYSLHTPILQNIRNLDRVTDGYLIHNSSLQHTETTATSNFTAKVDSLYHKRQRMKDSGIEVIPIYINKDSVRHSNTFKENKTNQNNGSLQRKRRAPVDEEADLAVLMQGENKADRDKMQEMIATDFSQPQNLDRPSPLRGLGPGAGGASPVFSKFMRNLKQEKENEQRDLDMDFPNVDKMDTAPHEFDKLSKELREGEEDLKKARSELRDVQKRLKTARTMGTLKEVKKWEGRNKEVRKKIKSLMERIETKRIEHNHARVGHQAHGSGSKRKLHGLVVIDPVWADWSSWSACSSDCGKGGFSVRRRECDTLPDVPCEGVHFDMRPCNAGTKCEAHWQEWGNWGPCSVTCGNGVRARSRVCMTGDREMKCTGESSLLEKCDLPLCEVPVAAAHVVHNQAPVALVPADQVGVESQVAGVSGGGGNIVLAGGGVAAGLAAGGAAMARPPPPPPVVPDSSQIRKHSRLQNYVWGNWGQWSSCSNACGEGDKTRSRYCIDISHNTAVKARTKHCGGGQTSQKKYCQGQCKGMPYAAVIGAGAVGAGAAGAANDYKGIHGGAVLEQEGPEGPLIVGSAGVGAAAIGGGAVVMEHGGEAGPQVIAQAHTGPVQTDEGEDESTLTGETILFLLLLLLCLILFIIAICIWFVQRSRESKLRKKLAASCPFYKQESGPDDDYRHHGYGLIKPVFKMETSDIPPNSCDQPPQRNRPPPGYGYEYGGYQPAPYDQGNVLQGGTMEAQNPMYMNNLAEQRWAPGPTEGWARGNQMQEQSGFGGTDAVSGANYGLNILDRGLGGQAFEPSTYNATLAQGQGPQPDLGGGDTGRSEVKRTSASSGDQDEEPLPVKEKKKKKKKKNKKKVSVDEDDVEEGLTEVSEEVGGDEDEGGKGKKKKKKKKKKKGNMEEEEELKDQEEEEEEKPKDKKKKEKKKKKKGAEGKEEEELKDQEEEEEEKPKDKKKKKKKGTEGKEEEELKDQEEEEEEEEKPKDKKKKEKKKKKKGTEGKQKGAPQGDKKKKETKKGGKKKSTEGEPPEGGDGGDKKKKKGKAKDAKKKKKRWDDQRSSVSQDEVRSAVSKKSSSFPHRQGRMLHQSRVMLSAVKFPGHITRHRSFISLHEYDVNTPLDSKENEELERASWTDSESTHSKHESLYKGCFYSPVDKSFDQLLPNSLHSTAQLRIRKWVSSTTPGLQPDSTLDRNTTDTTDFSLSSHSRKLSQEGVQKTVQVSSKSTQRVFISRSVSEISFNRPADKWQRRKNLRLNTNRIMVTPQPVAKSDQRSKSHQTSFLQFMMYPKPKARPRGHRSEVGAISFEDKVKKISYQLLPSSERNILEETGLDCRNLEQSSSVDRNKLSFESAVKENSSVTDAIDVVGENRNEMFQHSQYQTVQEQAMISNSDWTLARKYPELKNSSKRSPTYLTSTNFQQETNNTDVLARSVSSSVSSNECQPLNSFSSMRVLTQASDTDRTCQQTNRQPEIGLTGHLMTTNYSSTLLPFPDGPDWKMPKQEMPEEKNKSKKLMETERVGGKTCLEEGLETDSCRKFKAERKKSTQKDIYKPMLRETAVEQMEREKSEDTSCSVGVTWSQEKSQEELYEKENRKDNQRSEHFFIPSEDEELRDYGAKMNGEEKQSSYEEKKRNVLKLFEAGPGYQRISFLSPLISTPEQSQTVRVLTKPDHYRNSANTSQNKTTDCSSRNTTKTGHDQSVDSIYQRGGDVSQNSNDYGTPNTGLQRSFQTDRETSASNTDVDTKRYQRRTVRNSDFSLALDQLWESEKNKVLGKSSDEGNTGENVASKLTNNDICNNTKDIDDQNRGSLGCERRKSAQESSTRLKQGNNPITCTQSYSLATGIGSPLIEDGGKNVENVTATHFLNPVHTVADNAQPRSGDWEKSFLQVNEPYSPANGTDLSSSSFAIRSSDPPRRLKAHETSSKPAQATDKSESFKCNQEGYRKIINSQFDNFVDSTNVRDLSNIHVHWDNTKRSKDKQREMFKKYQNHPQPFSTSSTWLVEQEQGRKINQLKEVRFTNTEGHDHLANDQDIKHDTDYSLDRKLQKFDVGKESSDMTTNLSTAYLNSSKNIKQPSHLVIHQDKKEAMPISGTIIQDFATDSRKAPITSCTSKFSQLHEPDDLALSSVNDPVLKQLSYWPPHSSSDVIPQAQVRKLDAKDKSKEDVNETFLSLSAEPSTPDSKDSWVTASCSMKSKIKSPMNTPDQKHATELKYETPLFYPFATFSSMNNFVDTTGLENENGTIFHDPFSDVGSSQAHSFVSENSDNFKSTLSSDQSFPLKADSNQQIKRINFPTLIPEKSAINSRTKLAMTKKRVPKFVAQSPATKTQRCPQKTQDIKTDSELSSFDSCINPMEGNFSNHSPYFPNKFSKYPPTPCIEQVRFEDAEAKTSPGEEFKDKPAQVLQRREKESYSGNDKESQFPFQSTEQVKERFVSFISVYRESSTNYENFSSVSSITTERIFNSFDDSMLLNQTEKEGHEFSTESPGDAILSTFSASDYTCDNLPGLETKDNVSKTNGTIGNIPFERSLDHPSLQLKGFSQGHSRHAAGVYLSSDSVVQGNQRMVQVKHSKSHGSKIYVSDQGVIQRLSPGPPFESKSEQIFTDLQEVKRAQPPVPEFTDSHSSDQSVAVSSHKCNQTFTFLTSQHNETYTLSDAVRAYPLPVVDNENVYTFGQEVSYSSTNAHKSSPVSTSLEDEFNCIFEQDQSYSFTHAVKESPDTEILHCSELGQTFTSIEADEDESLPTLATLTDVTGMSGLALNQTDLDVISTLAHTSSYLGQSDSPSDHSMSEIQNATFSEATHTSTVTEEPSPQLSYLSQNFSLLSFDEEKTYTLPVSNKKMEGVSKQQEPSGSQDLTKSKQVKEIFQSSSRDDKDRNSTTGVLALKGMGCLDPSGLPESNRNVFHHRFNQSDEVKAHTDNLRHGYVEIKDGIAPDSVSDKQTPAKRANDPYDYRSESLKRDKGCFRSKIERMQTFSKDLRENKQGPIKEMCPLKISQASEIANPAEVVTSKTRGVDLVHKENIFSKNLRWLENDEKKKNVHGAYDLTPEIPDNTFPPRQLNLGTSQPFQMASDLDCLENPLVPKNIVGQEPDVRQCRNLPRSRRNVRKPPETAHQNVNHDFLRTKNHTKMASMPDTFMTAETQKTNGDQTLQRCGKTDYPGDGQVKESQIEPSCHKFESNKIKRSKNREIDLDDDKLSKKTERRTFENIPEHVISSKNKLKPRNIQVSEGGMVSNNTVGTSQGQRPKEDTYSQGLCKDQPAMKESVTKKQYRSMIGCSRQDEMHSHSASVLKKINYEEIHKSSPQSAMNDSGNLKSSPSTEYQSCMLVSTASTQMLEAQDSTTFFDSPLQTDNVNLPSENSVEKGSSPEKITVFNSISTWRSPSPVKHVKFVKVKKNSLSAPLQAHSITPFYEREILWSPFQNKDTGLTDKESKVISHADRVGQHHLTSTSTSLQSVFKLKSLAKITSNETSVSVESGTKNGGSRPHNQQGEKEIHFPVQSEASQTLEVEERFKGSISEVLGYSESHCSIPNTLSEVSSLFNDETQLDETECSQTSHFTESLPCSKDRYSNISDKRECGVDLEKGKEKMRLNITQESTEQERKFLPMRKSLGLKTGTASTDLDSKNTMIWTTQEKTLDQISTLKEEVVEIFQNSPKSLDYLKEQVDGKNDSSCHFCHLEDALSSRKCEPDDHDISHVNISSETPSSDDSWDVLFISNQEKQASGSHFESMNGENKIASYKTDHHSLKVFKPASKVNTGNSPQDENKVQSKEYFTVTNSRDSSEKCSPQASDQELQKASPKDSAIQIIPKTSHHHPWLYMEASAEDLNRTINKDEPELIAYNFPQTFGMSGFDSVETTGNKDEENLSMHQKCLPLHSESSDDMIESKQGSVTMTKFLTLQTSSHEDLQSDEDVVLVTVCKQESISKSSCSTSSTGSEEKESSAVVGLTSLFLNCERNDGRLSKEEDQSGQVWTCDDAMETNIFSAKSISSSEDQVGESCREDEQTPESTDDKLCQRDKDANYKSISNSDMAPQSTEKVSKLCNVRVQFSLTLPETKEQPKRAKNLPVRPSGSCPNSAFCNERNNQDNRTARSETKINLEKLSEKDQIRKKDLESNVSSSKERDPGKQITRKNLSQNHKKSSRSSAKLKLVLTRPKGQGDNASISDTDTKSSSYSSENTASKYPHDTNSNTCFTKCFSEETEDLSSSSGESHSPANLGGIFYSRHSSSVISCQEQLNVKRSDLHVHYSDSISSTPTVTNSTSTTETPSNHDDTCTSNLSHPFCAHSFLLPPPPPPTCSHSVTNLTQPQHPQVKNIRKLNVSRIKKSSLIQQKSLSASSTTPPREQREESSFSDSSSSRQPLGHQDKQVQHEIEASLKFFNKVDFHQESGTKLEKQTVFLDIPSLGREKSSGMNRDKEYHITVGNRNPSCHSSTTLGTFDSELSPLKMENCPGKLSSYCKYSDESSGSSGNRDTSSTSSSMHSGSVKSSGSSHSRSSDSKFSPHLSIGSEHTDPSSFFSHSTDHLCLSTSHSLCPSQSYSRPPESPMNQVRIERRKHCPDTIRDPPTLPIHSELPGTQLSPCDTPSTSKGSWSDSMSSGKGNTSRHEKLSRWGKSWSS